MALVGAAVIVAEVSGAIIGITHMVKRMNQNHAEKMADMKYKHDELILKLNNERQAAHEKHVEFMGLLQLYYEVVKTLGQEIFGAVCDGCKGLPGLISLSSLDKLTRLVCHVNSRTHILALERSHGQAYAAQVYETYQSNLRRCNNLLEQRMLTY